MFRFTACLASSVWTRWPRRDIRTSKATYDYASDESHMCIPLWERCQSVSFFFFSSKIARECDVKCVVSHAAAKKTTHLLQRKCLWESTGQTICILMSSKAKELSYKKKQNDKNKKTLTHLWPAAGGPVGWAGDVRVAGWYGLRLGHVFTVLGPQGFLLLHAHSLDAENRPFRLSRAPAARRAFLPLADPPANTKTHKMTAI